jgi:hypothetical protein
MVTGRERPEARFLAVFNRMHDAVSRSIVRIEAGLAEDPRRGRDLLFTRRVISWVMRLAERPSDELVLAAWGHVLDRWKLPRESHPKTTAGYHKWRKAIDVLSVEATSKILNEEGIDDATVARVCDLILKKNFPADREARILEDADCLAFLELKFESYLDEWDEEKTVRILRGTLEKMTPRAQQLALGLSLSARAQFVLKKAMENPA